jgi:V/A-type H+-transporting ATPase subunit C
LTRVKPAKDVDYLALSMRIHTMEKRLLTRERMDRMIDAKDLSEAAKVLTESGYGELREVNAQRLEEVLAQAQADLFQELSGEMENPAMLDVFRCKHDYHNAKVLVKSRALGRDYDRLLTRGGRFDPQALAEDFRGDGMDKYPETFRAAIAHAAETLGSTGDPQLADFILDRAYFRELTDLAASTGSTFLQGYAALLIDSANLRSTVRAHRLDKGSQFLSQVLAEGGTVDPITLADCRSDDLGSLFRTSPLGEAAALGATLAQPGAGAPSLSGCATTP